MLHACNVSVVMTCMLAIYIHTYIYIYICMLDTCYMSVQYVHACYNELTASSCIHNYLCTPFFQIQFLYVRNMDATVKYGCVYL